MNVASSEVFCGNLFAGRGFDQGWPSEEDRSLFLNDDGLIAHRRHIGSSCGARSENDRDLRDAQSRHACLIVKDSSKVIAIRKNFILKWQECSSGIDEIDTGEVVFLGDLLGTEVLLDCHGVITATLDCRIIGDDDCQPIFNFADAGHDSCCRQRGIIDIMCTESADLQKG